MKQLISIALLLAGLSLTLTGCGTEPTTVAPADAVDSPEKTAEEQAEYDRQMSEDMGN